MDNKARYSVYPGTSSRPILSVESRNIPGLLTPAEFYQVLEFPAPFAGMPFPSLSTPWKDISVAGFQHIVCLTDNSPTYEPSPLQFLHCVELQDLYGGKQPTNEEKEIELIETAVHVIKHALWGNEGVVVHCMAGTGRTGTVMGCVLRTLGFSAEKVLTFLDELHKRRGKPGWPESEWQSRLVERFS